MNSKFLLADNVFLVSIITLPDDTVSSITRTDSTLPMADNFLEKHYEEYEVRKAAYLRKKKHLPNTARRLPERPEDDAL